MLKLRNPIIGIIAISFLCTLFAEPIQVYGGKNFGHESVEAIDGTGLIKLSGTIVENEVHIIGSLISQNGEIGELDIIGEVNLTGTTVKHGGQIMGSIQTVRSKIEEPITLLCQKAVFTNSKLSDITVKQDSGFKGKQILELRLGTLVNGSIHFESGKGEVLVYPGSQVLGTVSGGKIIKKK